MSEHTPGPWEWWTSNSWRRLRHSERGVSTNVLYPVVYRDGQPDIEVTQADMVLIAAAPEMLAALKALEIQALQSNVNNGNDWGREALGMARAAIAKATTPNPHRREATE